MITIRKYVPSHVGDSRNLPEYETYADESSLEAAYLPQYAHLTNACLKLKTMEIFDGMYDVYYVHCNRWGDNGPIIGAVHNET